MGKSYSKQEEKEVIITQNAAGDNRATGIAEHHLYTSNVLLSTILAIAALVVAILLIKYYKRCHQGWMRKELRNEVLRRVQSRLSGRGGLRKGQGAHDVETGSI